MPTPPSARGPYTVVNKKHPLPGVDRHDYVSLARYFWPDPSQNPAACRTSSATGQTNPEIDEFDAKPLREMSAHVYTLALAGYLTGEAKYSARAAETAARLVPRRGDEDEPQPGPRPQLIKGGNAGRGYGIIESIRLASTSSTPSACSVRQTAQSTNLVEAMIKTKIQAWFGDYVAWMKQRQKNGQDEAAATNNHGCWYDAQAGELPAVPRRPTPRRSSSSNP